MQRFHGSCLCGEKKAINGIRLTVMFINISCCKYCFVCVKADYREVCQEMIKASWCGILASLSLLLEARYSSIKFSL